MDARDPRKHPLTQAARQTRQPGASRRGPSMPPPAAGCSTAGARGRPTRPSGQPVA